MTTWTGRSFGWRLRRWPSVAGRPLTRTRQEDFQNAQRNGGSQSHPGNNPPQPPDFQLLDVFLGGEVVYLRFQFGYASPDILMAAVGTPIAGKLRS